MKKIVSILVLSLFSSSFQALAFIKPIRRHSKSKVYLNQMGSKIIRPELYQADNNVVINGAKSLYSIQRDKVDNTIRVLTGDFGSVSRGSQSIESYKKLALNFLESNLKHFNLQSESLELVKEATLLDKDVQFLLFQAVNGDVPIKDSYISFRFKRKKLVQVANFTFPTATKISEAVLDEQELRAQINKKLPNRMLVSQGESYRIKEGEKGYELVKVREYQITSHDDIKLDLQVDQSTANIFELKEDKFYYHEHQHGFDQKQGQAFHTYYPRWYGDALVHEPFVHAKLKSAPSFPNIITDENGDFLADSSVTKLSTGGLNGKQVFIRNRTGATVTYDAILRDGTWVVDGREQENQSQPWINKRVAQGTVYAHVNKMLKHARNYINPAWFDQSLQANTNLSSNCNAHWDGRTINFYSGNDRCANTGLIADVIYHEWGHGLDANTGGIQDGAFSEGLGDIMSLIMTRSNLLGIGFMVQDSAPVRDLEPDKIYPRDRGEVHAEGLIIASTFWDLFKALSKKYNADRAVDLLSKYIFKGVYTARKYTELYDAILVIDDDDSDMSNGTPNTCVINKVFAQHGLAKTLNWCALATVKDFVVQDNDGDGVLEPGEKGSVFLQAFNPGMEVLQNLKARVSSTSTDVIIEKDTLVWGDIASQELALSLEPAVLGLKPGTVCGSSHKLNFHLTADAREVFVEKILVAGKNNGTSKTFAAGDLPQDILDYQRTVSTVVVDDEQWSSDPNVFKALLKFDINHTYIGDLTVTLISPAGQKFEVYAGRGGDDQVNFEQDISDLLGSIKGRGEWKLEVYDKASRDEGTLLNFSLELTPRLFVCD